MKVRPRLDFKSVAMVLFLISGSLKSAALANALPIDFTVLTALVLAGATAWHQFKTDYRIPVAVWKMTALFVLFLVPVLWTSATPYAQDKVARLFTLTLLAAFAPMLLFRRPADVQRFMNAALLLPLLLILYGFIELRNRPVRLETDAATPISLGMYAGMSIISLVFLARHLLKLRWAAMMMQAPALFVLISAGSRSAILALAAAAVPVARFFRITLKNIAVVTLSASVLWAAVSFLATKIELPVFSATRVQAFVSGQTLVDAQRMTNLRQALDHIVTAPLGLGWGGFGLLNRQRARGDDGTLVFVHNLVAEVFLEAGWVAGIVFVWLWASAILRLYRLARRERQATLAHATAILVFLSVLALISGEINDSRWLFTMIGLAMAVKTTAWEQGPAGEEFQTDLAEARP